MHATDLIPEAIREELDKAAPRLEVDPVDPLYAKHAIAAVRALYALPPTFRIIPNRGPDRRPRKRSHD